jgi:flagellar FliJ protein
MMRSKRFEPIQEIAASSATELSRAMGEAGRRVTDLEGQLVQLKKFRDEYAVDATAGGGSMESSKLQNYRSFLTRLGEALRQHLTKLDKARAEYERRRLLWSAKRVEVESLGRVIDRFRKEERYVAEQQEQHEEDDAAMRISLAHSEAGKH